MDCCGKNEELSGNISLWHTPYENLPLVKEYPNEPDIIKNPWNGWTELRNHKNANPYFGTGCPGIIELSVILNRYYINQANKQVDVILISSFGWIGNYYRELGRPALKETEIWWKNLRKKIDKASQKITICHPDNLTSGQKKTTIYAFPHALKAIENGKEVLNQPWSFMPVMTYEKNNKE